MIRAILDTNIYGEMLIDLDFEILKRKLSRDKSLVIYGTNLIRKELRDTPNNIRIQNKNLRISLLELYDAIVENHILEVNEKIKSLGENYYKAYREFGGSKSEQEIMNDFLIVACATLNNLDIVVSNDEKTMLTENAVRAYNLVNSVIRKRTPNFINYIKFKELL